MIEEQINKDYIAAMKAKDSAKSQALNFLRAQIKNTRIDKRVEQLEDQDVIAVIKKQVKQRQDSIEQFKAAARDDLIAKETNELVLLKSYLPEEIGEEKLRDLVKEAVAESGAQTMKDMGRVMKLMTEKTQGRADNKLVSELVKKSLAG